MRVPLPTLRSATLLVAACVLSGARLHAQRASAPADSAALEETLRAVTAVDSALSAAEARGDTAAMRRFFARAYYSVAPDGEMLNAGARLFRIARGMKATDSTQALTAPWVRTLGHDAVLVTRSTRLWGVRGGGQAAGLTFRVTRLYVREGDAWRLLFQQGTPLADEHVAARGPGAPPHHAPR